jgi:protein ImuB
VLVLEVELRRVDVGPVRLSVTLTHPNRDHAHLWTLLSPKLERAHLGFGVEEITLRAVRTGRWRGEQAAFLRDDARAGEPAALGELLDRLIDRLGPQAVTQIRAAETYVPEEAFVHASAGTKTENRKPKAEISPAEIYSAHRPSQLLERPEAVRVMSLVPDGPPMWLDWRGQAGEVVAASGPERIAFPWWTPQLGTTRDYFETEDEFGRRLWIFRDARSNQWFVHGQWT